MKQISQYEKEFTELFKTEKEIKYYLELVLKRIKFLESIYMTGGEWNCFSESFRDSAVKERQEKCQESSALYEIIRKNYTPDSLVGCNGKL